MSEPDAAAVSVRRLVLDHGGPPVIDALSFDLAPGRMLRVAGPNGAGKSTLLRALAGIDPPRSGTIQVSGHDLVDAPVPARRGLGYTSGECPFPYLDALEHLAIARHVHGVGQGRVDELLQRVADWAVVRSSRTQVRHCSQGMRQQLAFLLAVVHEPQVVLVDEGLDGIDADSVTPAITLLTEYLAAGASVVLVSHRAELVSALPVDETLWVGPAEEPAPSAAANLGEGRR